MSHLDEIQKLTFEALVNFHKQEGQEELAYLTILFTVIIGIIGFLGSAQKIEKRARVLILLFYVGLHFTMTMSFLESMKIHSAIHDEIAAFVQYNPHIFMDEEKSSLFKELSKMHGHKIGSMAVGSYLLLSFMIISILSLGPNRILRWKTNTNLRA